MIYGGGVFLILLICANTAALKYAFSEGDFSSIVIILKHAVFPLAGLLCVCVFLWGLGRTVLDRFSRAVATTPPPLIHAVAFATGLGVAGTALTLLGLAGLLQARITLGLLLIAVYLSKKQLGRLICLEWPSVPRLSRWQGVVAGLLLYGLWHAIILGLAPVTAWDVTAYHLVLSKFYAAWGAIREIPWLLHSHWPHMMEVLYVPAFWFAAPSTAALLHTAVCAAFVLAVYGAASREFDARTAWLGAGLLACQPVLLRLAPMAHGDGAYALFVFLSSYFVWRWQKERSLSLLILAGILGGFGAASKLLGMYPAVVLALYIGYAAFKERGGRRYPLMYLGCVWVIASPWYLKTWMGAGNPVWPFFSTLWGGRFGAEFLEAPYLASNRWSWPMDGSVVLRYGPQYLLLPAAACFGLVRFSGRTLPPFLRFLLLQALLFIPLVFRHNEGWRFFLPFYPAFALTAAWSASKLTKEVTGKSAAAMLCLLFGVSGVVGVSQNNELFPVLGLRSRIRPAGAPRELYLERTLDNYIFYKRAKAVLGPGDKVLLFREIRGFYLDADYLWGDPWNQGLIIYRDLEDVDALYARVRELGITHVLVNRGLGIYAPRNGYYDVRTASMMEGLLSARAQTVLASSRIALYRLD